MSNGWEFFRNSGKIITSIYRATNERGRPVVRQLIHGMWLIPSDGLPNIQAQVASGELLPLPSTPWGNDKIVTLRVMKVVQVSGTQVAITSQTILSAATGVTDYKVQYSIVTDMDGEWKASQVRTFSFKSSAAATKKFEELGPASGGTTGLVDFVDGEGRLRTAHAYPPTAHAARFAPEEGMFQVKARLDGWHAAKDTRERAEAEQRELAVEEKRRREQQALTDLVEGPTVDLDNNSFAARMRAKRKLQAEQDKVVMGKVGMGCDACLSQGFANGQQFCGACDEVRS